MPDVPLIVTPDADDPDFATVMVDGTVAGRPYRFLLDTGAARTRLAADEYTGALRPVGDHVTSASFGGTVTEPVVTVTDLAVGPLRLAELDVVLGRRGSRQILGMDVLGRYRCHVRLAAGVLGVAASSSHRPANEFVLGRRGHVYVDVDWPGVRAAACWDTGAGATVIDHGFRLRHPELFEQVGVSVGTDANGDEVRTPLLLTEPVIGGRAFGRHQAVAVDLSMVNSTLDRPMDLILGYPTIRMADWLFDFPAGRWAFAD